MSFSNEYPVFVPSEESSASDYRIAERINSLTARDGLFSALTFLDTLPFDQQLYALNKAIEPVRAAVPANDPETLSSARAREAISDVAHLFECWAGSGVYNVLTSDQTGTLQGIVVTAWPRCVQWLQFLTENFESIGFQSRLNESVQVPELCSQLLLIVCANFLCSAYANDTLRGMINRDANVVQILIDIHLKVNAQRMQRLEEVEDVAFWMYSSPSRLLALVLLAQINPTPNEPPIPTEHGCKEMLCRLEKYSGSIVDTALQHLTLDVSSPPSAPLQYKIQRISDLMHLLHHLSSVETFKEQLRRPRTVSTVAKVLQLCISSKDSGRNAVIPIMGMQHAFYFSVSSVLKDGLGLLNALFTTDPYANRSIIVALNAGVAETCAAVTHWHTSDPSMPEGEKVIGKVFDCLVQFSRCSHYRAVVYKLTGAIESAFALKMVTRIIQNESVGSIWAAIRSRALERAICRYLFDKAHEAVRKKCTTCSRRFSYTKVCSACKTLRYCSRACQRKSWKLGHKAQCKAFQLALPKIYPEEVGVGHKDPYFQQVIAGKDMARHSFALNRLLREKYPNLAPNEVIVRIKYTSGDFRPKFTIRKAPSDTLEMLDARWLPLTQYSGLPRMKLMYVESEVTSGGGVRKVTFPINGNWNTSLDFDLLYETCREPYSEGHMFKRSVFQSADGTSLKAQRDEVDEVLEELWVLTEQNPQWSLWKRIKRAVREVERNSVARGKNLYDGWYPYR